MRSDTRSVHTVIEKIGYRNSSLQKVDEEFERYMQEKESTEEEYAAEYNSIFEYRDNYGDISLVINNLERKNPCGGVRKRIITLGTE